MKKKLISLFLIGAMTTGMVAGCGSGNSNADAGNNASSDNAALEVLAKLRGKKIFLFGTAGFGGSKEYFDKILKKAEHSLDKSNTVFGCYMCQGKMPMSVRQRYEEMKKQPIHLPNLDAMIENFDKALSHPDADDLEQLKQAVR